MKTKEELCECGHIRFHHSHDKDECIEQDCPCKKFIPQKKQEEKE